MFPGSLTPRLYEQAVRLGSWIPSFEKAAQLLQEFTGTAVSEATLRRDSEQAGAKQVQAQEQAVAAMLKEPGKEAQGPAKLLVSVDGANVPLVGGVWAEVKTLVVGEVQPAVERGGERVVATIVLSYFSRMAEARSFEKQALVETQRRGVATAGQVGAVTDGALWNQEFVNYHRPDALRILDFPHAAEHIHAIGEMCYGEGSETLSTWLQSQLHTLKHGGPSAVLAELEALYGKHPEWSETGKQHLDYLKKRVDQMQYPTYQADGWPIGDGAVESGNKLVVEARLKGSGMHWAPPHVNPLLALRNVVCNDRWEEDWPQIATDLRQEAWQRRLTRQQLCAQPSADPLTCAMEQQVVVPPTVAPTPLGPQGAANAQPDAPPPPSAVLTDSAPHRPAANHPWRRSPIGKARYQTMKPSPPAKP